MSQLGLAGTFQPGYSAMTTGTIQTAEGDYLLAGRLYDENDQSSGVAIRVNPGGELEWQMTYSSVFSEFFEAVTQIADGNFVATGSFFYSEYSGDEYIWIVKFDSEGNKIWEGAFGGKNQQNDGLAITATSDGGFAVAGLILDLDTDHPSTWVLKFDRDCNLQWDKTYDGGVAFAITQTRNGGYVLSGAHNLTGSLNSNVYVLRLDQNGNKVWERNYPEMEVYVLLESGIIETADGNFVLVAKSVFMKLDPCGNIIWAYQNGDLSLKSIVQMPEGTYAIGGSIIINYFDHAYVAVLGPDGAAVRWDNTEILYNSGVAQVFVNQDGYLTGGGYAPVNENQSLMFLAVYNDVRTIVP